MQKFFVELFIITLFFLCIFSKKIWLAVFYKRHKYCPKCKTELKKTSKLRKNKKKVTFSIVHVSGPMAPRTVEEALYCPKCRYEIMANPFANPENYR